MHAWRSGLLRLFGARLGRNCHVYASARVWAPWNLRCGDDVGVADGVEIYNPSLITIGDHSVISQGAYLCGASHDPDRPGFPLTSAPMVVGRNVWVAARAIVLMGLQLGDGCVIGAGSVVTRSMPAGAICAGNPCRVIRRLEQRKRS